MNQVRFACVVIFLGFIVTRFLYPSDLGSQPYAFSKLRLEPHSLPGNVLGVSFADFDADGYIDLYTAGRSGANKLLRNMGSLTFEDVAPALGIAGNSRSRVGVWADIDNNGFPDLFVANTSDCRIYQNISGGHFEEITAATGLVLNSLSNSALWADVNHDGLIDLYSANFRARNTLFLNSHHGSFTDHVHASGLDDPNEYAMGGVFGDYDNDGDIDLYLVHDGYQRFILYNNDGFGNFRDVSREAGVDYEGMGMGTVFADFDNDGLLDLYITNLHENTIYFNNGDGTFTNKTTHSEVGDLGMGWGVVAIDYDNDMLLDIYVVNTSSFHSPKLDNVLYRNLGNRRFEIVTEAAGVSSLLDGYAAAAADLNNDGYQDLAVSNYGNEGLEIFINNGGSNNFALVELTGSQSNRYAIGARVRLVANGIQQRREVSGGSGYLSQDSPVLHFGLAQAAIIDTLEILWPSGNFDSHYDLEVNRKYRFSEGQTTTNVDDETRIPESVALLAAYPNPFSLRATSRSSQALTFEFELSAKTSTFVTLAIYDVRGRLVSQLTNKSYSPGRHKVVWNGKNAIQNNLPAGLYFARLHSGNYNLAQKIILVR